MFICNLLWHQTQQLINPTFQSKIKTGPDLQPDDQGSVEVAVWVGGVVEPPEHVGVRAHVHVRPLLVAVSTKRPPRQLRLEIRIPAELAICKTDEQSETKEQLMPEMTVCASKRTSKILKPGRISVTRS